MNLPQLSDFNFQGKRVIVRGDFDVPLGDGKILDDSRLKECLPTIKYLLENGAKEIVLMGHLGRPDGKVVEELKLAPVAQKLRELIEEKFQIPNSNFQTISNSQIFKIQNFDAYQISENVVLLENLRFDSREEGNEEGFARQLAGLGDFFVNEAFATSHRGHASIVGIPKLLPHCAGLHFAEEVENLSRVLENPKRSLVFVIGGAKPETKLPLVADFAKMADWVLIGGTLCQMSNMPV